MASDTKHHRNKFFEWLDKASDAVIGALVKEYLLESNHASWDPWSWRQIRAFMELHADMNRYRVSTPPDQFTKWEEYRGAEHQQCTDADIGRRLGEMFEDMDRHRESSDPPKVPSDQQPGSQDRCKLVTIVFEVSEQIDLHELLCTAIHESDALALTQLKLHVANIEEVSG